MSTETRDSLEKVIRALAVEEHIIHRTADAMLDRAEDRVGRLEELRHELEDLVGIEGAGSDEIVAEAGDRARELMEG